MGIAGNHPTSWLDAMRRGRAAGHFGTVGSENEPVCALDVFVRPSILNLLAEVRARCGPTMVTIAHGHAVVKTVSDRVSVMYLVKLVKLGKLVEMVEMAEMAGSDELCLSPAHPSAEALMTAFPAPDATRPGTSSRSIGDPS